MNQIQLDVKNPADVQALFELADNNEDVEVIQEKNFSGDITTIELYISMAVNVVALVVPLIKTFIKQGKLSSLVINGDKIELKNVSQELIEKVIEKKLCPLDVAANTNTDDECSC